MKEKRNIEDLFEDRFKNFEAKPSPRVWKNIQAELERQKKDRKVIPLWIKLGGVAAVLALMLSVGNWVFNPLNDHNSSITQEEVINNNKENNSSEKPLLENETNNKNIQVASEVVKTDVEEDDNQNSLQNTSVKTENKISDSNKKINSSTIAVENSKYNSSDKKSNRNAIANHDADKSSSVKEKTSKENLIPENGYRNNANQNSRNDTRLTSNISSERNSNSVKQADKNPIKIEKDISEIKNNAVVSAEKPANEGDNKTLLNKEAEKTADAKNKKSILDAIAEQNDAAATKTKNQKPENRWEVAPNVAPVYYSSLGNGSSIDPSFSDNSQSGDVNMSYGVQVSYALNNRLSVRTGLNNVDLSYSTGGIELATAPVGEALRSVDYGGKGIVVTAVNKGTFAKGTSNDFGDIQPKSTQGDARLIQNINYYEVPVELKYALLNSKFGVNVIGGVSTLFLGNNEISVKADNYNNVLGDANNLSTVSFSTNVGLGLDYKLSKRFKFNIEPMFKYQVNPYTDSSVNFKPYYLGVYSGISFKF